MMQHILTLQLQGMNNSAEPATDGTLDRFVLVVRRGSIAQFTYCTSLFLSRNQFAELATVAMLALLCQSSGGSDAQLTRPLLHASSLP